MSCGRQHAWPRWPHVHVNFVEAHVPAMLGYSRTLSCAGVTWKLQGLPSFNHMYMHSYAHAWTNSNIHVTARTEKQASKKATYKSSHRSWVAYTTYKGWGKLFQTCVRHAEDASDLGPAQEVQDNLRHRSQEQRHETHTASRHITKLRKPQANTFHSFACACMWRRCFSCAGLQPWCRGGSRVRNAMLVAAPRGQAQHREWHVRLSIWAFHPPPRPSWQGTPMKKTTKWGFFDKRVNRRCHWHRLQDRTFQTIAPNKNLCYRCGRIHESSCRVPTRSLQVSFLHCKTSLPCRRKHRQHFWYFQVHNCHC